WLVAGIAGVIFGGLLSAARRGRLPPRRRRRAALARRARRCCRGSGGAARAAGLRVRRRRGHGHRRRARPRLHERPGVERRRVAERRQLGLHARRVRGGIRARAGDEVGMALMFALAIGIAFGFTLERAGLGTAPKLAGQFYLADFTVMKVMFTAIVVAMTGAFWLGRLGVLDLASVYVPETFLLPQIAGGAIFGVG